MDATQAATMGINDSIASAGVTRNGARIFAATAVVMVIAFTAYGLLAQPTFTRLTLDTLFGDRGSLGALFVIFAIGLGIMAAGSILGTRALDHRWPWPLGRRSPGSVSRRWPPALLSNFALILGMRWIEPSLPQASGLYDLPEPDAWLSVLAPADYAILGVVAVLAWAFAFTLGVLVVIVWDLLRPAARSRSRR